MRLDFIVYLGELDQAISKVMVGGSLWVLEIPIYEEEGNFVDVADLLN
jgi:hypothetical protein